MKWPAPSRSGWNGSTPCWSRTETSSLRYSVPIGTRIHIAFGHVHVNTSGTRGEISFSGSRGTCHKILADPTADFADYVDHGPAYDIILVEPDSVCVHNIDPAGPNRLIAREHATPDERGSWTTFRDAAIDRWM